MRNPVRSEADAFHIVVGSAAVLVASAVLGTLLSPPVGIALVGGAVAGALVWEVATTDPGRRWPLRDAIATGRRNAPRGRRQLLVVGNRTLASEALRARLLQSTQDDIHFVVPILSSRAHYIATDVDRELRDARARLRDALAWAREHELRATGKVGDPNAAFLAIEDELRRSGADEVIISTLPLSQSNWLEAGVIERLQEELDVPITHLIAESAPVESRA